MSTSAPTRPYLQIQSAGGVADADLISRLRPEFAPPPGSTEARTVRAWCRPSAQDALDEPSGVLGFFDDAQVGQFQPRPGGKYARPPEKAGSAPGMSLAAPAATNVETAGDRPIPSVRQRGGDCAARCGGGEGVPEQVQRVVGGVAVTFAATAENAGDNLQARSVVVSKVDLA